MNFNSNPWGNRTLRRLLLGSEKKLFRRNFPKECETFDWCFLGKTSNPHLTESNTFEGRVFSEWIEVFWFYESTSSSNAGKKTNALLEDNCSGFLKRPMDTLMETIKHVVTHKSDFESWNQEQNRFYHTVEFLEYQEFDSRLELKK